MSEELKNVIVDIGLHYDEICCNHNDMSEFVFNGIPTEKDEQFAIMGGHVYFLKKLIDTLKEEFEARKDEFHDKIPY